jgi:type II secretory pathway pseudopilin PulG
MIAARPDGFTLVEALVAGIVGVIIAAVVFTMYIMYESQARESSAYSMLQRQYDNVAEQIAFDVRRGYLVLGPGETWADPFTALTRDTVSDIRVFSRAGALVGQYSISNDTLKETGGVPFNAGGGVVRLDEARSSFILPGLRTSVDVRLRLKTTAPDTTYYLSARKDAFRCRN